MKRLGLLLMLAGVFITPLKAKKNISYYLIGESFQGLTLYSWLVPVGLNLKDNTALGIGLLSPMAWTGISYANTFLSDRISSGMILSSLYGGWSGFAQGALMGNSGNRGSFALALSTLENFGNYHLFNALNLNSATAQRWWNFAGLGLFDFGIVNEFKGNNVLYAAVPLVTSYGSIPFFMNDNKANWGDAFFEMVSSSTILGSAWLLSLGVDDGSLDNKTYRVSTGVGFSTIGYGIGYLLGRNRDISTGAAIFTLIVPSLVDMMITGSIVLLSGSPEVALISSGIFIPVGVYSSYYLFSKRSIIAENDKTGRINFMINPYLGAFALVKNVRTKLKDIPIGMLTYSF